MTGARSNRSIPRSAVSLNACASAVGVGAAGAAPPTGTGTFPEVEATSSPCGTEAGTTGVGTALACRGADVSVAPLSCCEADVVVALHWEADVVVALPIPEADVVVALPWEADVVVALPIPEADVVVALPDPVADVIVALPVVGADVFVAQPTLIKLLLPSAPSPAPELNKLSLLLSSIRRRRRSLLSAASLSLCL
jgi:hypothetical protein